MPRLSEQLPETYTYADPGTIAPNEVIDLRDAADWGTERNEDVWEGVLQQSIATIGVRDSRDSLVGIGFLAGNPRHALLCDFVVHPSHRGIGIGSAILNRRINIADALNIPYLYTELAATNKLRKQYEELGFISTGHAYTRAARRHPSELAES